MSHNCHVLHLLQSFSLWLAKFCLQSRILKEFDQLAFQKLLDFPDIWFKGYQISDTIFDQIIRILPFLFSTSTSSESQETNCRELETRSSLLKHTILCSFQCFLSRCERGRKCEMEMKTDFSKILTTENAKVLLCCCFS